MKNTNANDLALTPPYTLDSLLSYLPNLPDALMQHYLKECFTELKKLSGNNGCSPEALQRISNDLVELDLPLVGRLPWDIFTENLPWVQPYYKWVQCLAAGKNSVDCILPEAFLNWQENLPAESADEEKSAITDAAADSSLTGHGFSEETAKILLSTWRNYRRYYGQWDQESEDFYRKML